MRLVKVLYDVVSGCRFMVIVTYDGNCMSISEQVSFSCWLVMVYLMGYVMDDIINSFMVMAMVRAIRRGGWCSFCSMDIGLSDDIFIL